jgi:hypothetical protein
MSVEKSNRIPALQLGLNRQKAHEADAQAAPETGIGINVKGLGFSPSTIPCQRIPSDPLAFLTSSSRKAELLGRLVIKNRPHICADLW